MTDKIKRIKYTITLKSINPEIIEDKYDLSIEPGRGKTKISELSGNITQKTMVFLGPSRQLHKCNVSMIDHITKTDTTRNKYNCFWCKNSFDNLSIGCPISHNPSKIYKKYTSIINSNDYIIQEDSHKDKDDSVYVTDGVFCSFNCCVSYVDDNKTNPLYINSKMLLIRLYNEMFNKNITVISTAPSWRTLLEYGGHMDINEFRESFDKVEYQNHGITKDFSSNMKSIGVLFEKKLKF